MKSWKPEALGGKALIPVPVNVLEKKGERESPTVASDPIDSVSPTGIVSIPGQARHRTVGLIMVDLGHAPLSWHVRRGPLIFVFQPV